jgi:hypothetical protein
VTLTSGLRTRVLLILLLVVAAAAAGLMVLSRAHQDTSGDAAPAPTPTATSAAATRPTTTAHSAKPSATPSATSPPAKAPVAKTPVAKTPAHPAPSAAPKAAERPAAQPDPDRLPAAIRTPLSADRVVVVALYDPKAKIDGTALREAKAGAGLARTTFVAIDVRKNQVAPLNARYGVIQDPAVLVLRPPGDLVVRIDGFADRDTVAQAAANAAT